MKHIFLTLILSSFVTLAKASEARAQEHRIKLFISELNEFMNAKDLESVVGAWVDEGEKFTLDGGIFRGKDELRKHYSHLFRNAFPDARYQFDVQYVRFHGKKTAIVDGVWKTHQAGPPSFPSCGIFLFHLEEVAHQWKLRLSMATVPRQGNTANHGRELSWTQECSEHREMTRQ